MKPLTIQQLEALGFTIQYKKRKGEQVFDQCYMVYDENFDYTSATMLGVFYRQPTFHDIVEQIVINVKHDSKYRIINKFFDI